MRQLHANFESKFRQSRDLCYRRRTRTHAGADAFGCGTPRDAVWQESSERASAWGISYKAARARANSSGCAMKREIYYKVSARAHAHRRRRTHATKLLSTHF
ncbi:hypothetical protein AADW59_00575 [Candidatus Hodgkinia cicadicola]